RNTDDRPMVEYRAPRDLIEVGRGLSSHHPEVLAEFTRTVVPPAGGPLGGWPRELVLRARAAAMLEAAGDAEAARVYAELRAAGAEAIASELAASRKEELLHQHFAAKLAEAHELAERGDATGARAALEEVIAQGGGAVEDWLLLARMR